MISLIICSRSKQMVADIDANVKYSIGIPYEIIAIDNSGGNYGICEAYNIGAKQSQYNALCFMHEDLRFHSDNWGQVVLDILALPDTGVLGVAGGTYQFKAPTSWIANTIPCLRTNVLHSTGKPFLRIDYWNPEEELLAEVATVDGLWMCCRKSVWQEFPFDQKNFPHFHFYDIDFCTSIHKKYRNYVTYDVLIEHFSEGTFKIDWVVNALHYYKVRQQYLPFGTTNIVGEEARWVEFKIFQQALKNLINYKADVKYIAYCAYCCLKYNYLDRDTLWIIKQYIKSKIFSKHQILN